MEERGRGEIRSIKGALRSVLGSQVVTEEVLTTVLVEVEEILNSKPLGYVSSSADDLVPVTPNLLLMGRRDASLPQVIYADSNTLSQGRWRHSQVLADQFWTRFIRNYLPNLQIRQKWQQDQGNLKDSDVVMILDPRLPFALWPIGKVLKTFLGKDGRVRVAEIEIKGKSHIRPVSRLIPLPFIKD